MSQYARAQQRRQSGAWPALITNAGWYEVYTRSHIGTGTAPNAPFTVHHAGGTTTVAINQQQNQSECASVADAVKLVRLADPRRVQADAIKFVPNTAEDLLYVHTDHLGAPQKLTDETGTVVWDATFRPYGEEDAITGTAETNQRLPGQYFDIESALHYNYQRHYDPATGRYLQSDPIGLAGGLNTYAYANLNPIRYTYPKGLQAGGISTPAGPFPILIPPVAQPGSKEEAGRKEQAALCDRAGRLLYVRFRWPMGGLSRRRAALSSAPALSSQPRRMKSWRRCTIVCR